MTQRKCLAGWEALACALGIALAVGAAKPAAASASGLGSLDYAFRFASAISSDDKDRAKAQEAVLQDYITCGAAHEAIARVDQMAGWRQGTMLADLAASEARAGRKSAASELIRRAEQVESAVSGWEGPRVQAHIAAALAAMGEMKPAQEIAGNLRSEDPRQYKGQAAYTIASGHLMRREFEAAMAELKALDSDPDIDTAVWRTRGYLLAGQSDGIAAAQRLAALEATLESAKVLDGWIRVEIAEDAAAELAELGRPEKARGALEEAEKAALALPEALHAKATPLAELARAWGRLGETGRSRQLLKKVEPAAGAALDIDRPSLYARLASVRRAIGDQARAEQLYGQSLSAAESLKNARPRALAVVDICRFLGRDGVDPSGAVKARLDALLSGLKDPW
ncbi:MAG TPA: hypothetical protein VFW45_15635 [Candidatus Polarisedimenticolia bacterium]|nr:hypothetical protein [Candidatus Polarisedimenticolia bacterium]